jgi:4-hydroxy-2-oxoheptanedioate aldolase
MLCHPNNRTPAITGKRADRKGGTLHAVAVARNDNGRNQVWSARREGSMRINTAKQKMLAGEPVFGFALGLGSPTAAELIGNSGGDFVFLDGQHGSFGPESTLACLQALSGSPAPAMARVARNDYTLIGRLLDEGVLGVVVPMVHTAEDAKEAADACRFPPAGTRSWGWGRAANLGADYPAWINDQVFVAVQIESAQAAENAEAILATPGVDGCWIGPGDLSLSLGVHPSQATTDERVLAAVEATLAACRNTGTVCGYACASVAQGLALAARGMQFLTVASDIGFLLTGAQAARDQIQAARAGK